MIALIAAAAPLALYALSKTRKDESIMGFANQAIFVSILLQAVALGAFIFKVKTGIFTSPGCGRQFRHRPCGRVPLSLPASSVASSCRSFIFYCCGGARTWKSCFRPRIRSTNLFIKRFGIGFPLLTLMIAAGAYWANRTWGSYWSWDPKETWAAITWLVYAGYLHMRITRGWRGRRAAYFAILGFAVVMFTFFGVTYLLPGLHAYA